MRCLVERVQRASVAVGREVVGTIGRGLLVYVACLPGDTPEQTLRLAERLTRLRIFPDSQGRFNLSAADIGGSLLLVPAFTLAADCQRGHRPSLSGAAAPEESRPCFEALVAACLATGLEVACGVFGQAMVVEAVNDGPVTCLLGEPAAVCS